MRLVQLHKTGTYPIPFRYVTDTALADGAPQQEEAQTTHWTTSPMERVCYAHYGFCTTHTTAEGAISYYHNHGEHNQ